MTERLRRARPKGAAALRKFGLVMAAAWAVLASVSWWRSSPAAVYLAGLAIVFLGPAILWPRALGPVERAWMTFANVLSVVMTRVILTLTFYLVITPIGLLLRLLHKDVLGLRADRKAQSFWLPIEPNGPSTRPDKPY